MMGGGRGSRKGVGAFERGLDRGRVVRQGQTWGGGRIMQTCHPITAVMKEHKR